SCHCLCSFFQPALNLRFHFSPMNVVLGLVDKDVDVGLGVKPIMFNGSASAVVVEVIGPGFQLIQRSVYAVVVERLRFHHGELDVRNGGALVRAIAAKAPEQYGGGYTPG